MLILYWLILVWPLVNSHYRFKSISIHDDIIYTFKVLVTIVLIGRKSFNRISYPICTSIFSSNKSIQTSCYKNRYLGNHNMQYEICLKNLLKIGEGSGSCYCRALSKDIGNADMHNNLWAGWPHIL